MDATHLLAAPLVVAFALLGSAKLAAVPSMRDRAQHVGMTTGSYRAIGGLELLATAGILAGVVAPALGVAAGAGLVLLLGGAVVTHLRSGDGARELAPAILLGAVSAAYVVIAVRGA